MFGAIAKRVFGTANDRYIKTLDKTVAAINALEPEFEALDDDALKAKTDEFRQRLEAGETEDDLLIEAFATVREAAKRALGQRHYDVQLKGGMVLHKGKISEMRTGEGKTLVATLPVYLNALSGKGVHVVTVNDYLASRDAEWMGKVYGFLGLTTGCIVHELDDEARKAAYGSDITYGTNNELGFDYLRDNMKFRLEDMVQRPFHFGIVDEVDSILVDEARTPLIISGLAEDSSELYRAVDKVIPLLEEPHWEKDEKARSVVYTEEGQERVEELLRDAGLLQGDGNLYDPRNVSILHHATQGLRAHKLFTRDDDYMVRAGKVVIIDEFTGRAMEGRRYADGLHQALEAKEGVEIRPENQTLASITFQNYFRMYPKLAGMTGTAMTEAAEFQEIYGLEVVDIPTNRDMARLDQDDEVYRTVREKFEAIAILIKDCVERGQPVLVGTTSIEKSEYLADLLRKQHKVKPAVLNARYHEQEAFIVAQAGVPGAVTIATNMAGRGTDIQLGGNVEMRVSQEAPKDADEAALTKTREKIVDEVEKLKAQALDAGGLYVIGTERHESRRVDNQLRGRSGRQGDPGASKFFLSLEDDLMRIFGSDRMEGMLRKLGLEEGEAIVHPWINKALEKAQQKVEARNFEVRKNLLKFDDVMNDQRRVIYEQRRDLMVAEEVQETVAEMRREVLEMLVEENIPPKAMPEEWDVDHLDERCKTVLGMELPVKDWAEEEGVSDEEILERMQKQADQKIAAKTVEFGAERMRWLEKNVLLQLLDASWKEHLLHLEHLRQGISLRAYGQRDPLNEYKAEAFEMFQTMLSDLREKVTYTLFNMQLAPMPTAEEEEEARKRQQAQGMAVREEPEQAVGGGPPTGVVATKPLPMSRTVAPEDRDPNDPSTWGRVSRNEPCPCGSGKKYKNCHGRV